MIQVKIKIEKIKNKKKKLYFLLCFVIIDN